MHLVLLLYQGSVSMKDNLFGFPDYLLSSSAVKILSTVDICMKKQKDNKDLLLLLLLLLFECFDWAMLLIHLIQILSNQSQISIKN